MSIDHHSPRLSKDALVARMHAIESARDRMRAGHQTAASEIRRIARLTGAFADACGSERLAELAASLDESGAGDFSHQLVLVLQELGRLIDNCKTPPANILVVEDDPIAAQVLANHLEAPTRRIFLARSTREAESILADHGVSLVLLDLLLPDSDGRNFLVELRRRPELDGVPVIINSAVTSAETRVECYTLGADEFFHKPISPAVLSAAVSSKLQRAREIFLQSRTDRLTGLGNRTAVIEAFRRLEFLVDRGGSSLSLAILDVDRFKRVNDAFGHATGDGVLRFLAQVLTRHLRDSDVIGRWGGEEFVVLFPGTGHLSAAAALEKTLGIFRAHIFEAPAGAPFSVSFSGGVVEVQPGDGLEQAIGRADGLMYAAKAAGRNRILAAALGEEPESPRLLLVLRDPVLGPSVQFRLQQEGFDALLKTDAASAFEAAPGFAADLLLMEMDLSDMTGLALLDRLKRLPAYRNLPVLMLADAEHQGAMEQGLALGVSDFVFLPLSQVELITRIRRLIRRLRLPQADAAQGSAEAGSL